MSSRSRYRNSNAKAPPVPQTSRQLVRLPRLMNSPSQVARARLSPNPLSSVARRKPRSNVRSGRRTKPRRGGNVKNGNGKSVRPKRRKNVRSARSASIRNSRSVRGGSGSRGEPASWINKRRKPRGRRSGLRRQGSSGNDGTSWTWKLRRVRDWQGLSGKRWRGRLIVR